LKKGGKTASPRGKRGDRALRGTPAEQTIAGDTDDGGVPEAGDDDGASPDTATSDGASREIPITDGASPDSTIEDEVTPPGETPESTETDQADAATGSETQVPLAEQLEAARAESARRHEDWLRALAEAENLRKRSARELLDQTRRAREQVLVEFLAVVDDVERAIEAIRDGGEQPENHGLRQGVELIHTRLLEVLARFEVRPIECLGEAFDPHQHEAVMRDPSSDLEPDHVTQVMQKGYRIGEQVLRPARVAVSS